MWQDSNFVVLRRHAENMSLRIIRKISGNSSGLMFCLKCSLISFSVQDTVGGDQGKERIVFLAPSQGSKPIFIGKISGESWQKLMNSPFYIISLLLTIFFYLKCISSVKLFLLVWKAFPSEKKKRLWFRKIFHSWDIQFLAYKLTMSQMI